MTKNYKLAGVHKQDGTVLFATDERHVIGVHVTEQFWMTLEEWQNLGSPDKIVVSVEAEEEELVDYCDSVFNHFDPKD